MADYELAKTYSYCAQPSGVPELVEAGPGMVQAWNEQAATVGQTETLRVGGRDEDRRLP